VGDGAEHEEQTQQKKTHTKQKLGRKVNLDKSTIFIGNSCQEEIKNEVKQKLGVHNESLQDSYLGMPTQIGLSLIVTLRYLFDRMRRRINGLSDRPLSRKGNEVMLKAVIQVIPTYVRSCFELPVATCDMMRKVIANQWRCFKDGKTKMHW
jgi:hypothetical protein